MIPETLFIITYEFIEAKGMPIAKKKVGVMATDVFLAVYGFESHVKNDGRIVSFHVEPTDITEII